MCFSSWGFKRFQLLFFAVLSQAPVVVQATGGQVIREAATLGTDMSRSDASVVLIGHLSWSYIGQQVQD